MKKEFLIAILLFPFFQNFAFGHPDTLIPDRKYSGYRLQVTNLKILKKEPEYLKLSCTAVNTGKFDLHFKNGSNLAFLQLSFDQSLPANNLEDYAEAIRKSILEERLKLKVGEFKENIILKVETQTPPLAAKKEPQIELIFNETPDPGAGAAGQTNSKSVTEKPIEEKEIVFETPNFESKTLEEILEEKNKCPDLVFDTLVLLSGDGKTATLKFQISNVGKGPATIYKKGNKREENLGIRAFISGSSAVSKGAIVIGGEFLSEGLEKSEGLLFPGQSFSGFLTFDVRKKTRYMQTLVLSLDAYLILHECDRTNNTAAVLLN